MSAHARLSERERQLGVEMRRCYERGEHPPVELRERHRLAWLWKLAADRSGEPTEREAQQQ